MPSTIAIVGSVDPARADELELVDVNQAQAASEALGRALADAGCNIVVYSSAQTFVEPEVVRGYVSSGRPSAGSIQVRYPDGGDCSFPEMQQHDALFVRRPDVSRGWEVSFYRSLFNVDGVLVIGGGKSTLVAGLIAISAKTPVVAVAAFGGKAREVRAALALAKNDATEEELELMGRAWQASAAPDLVRALGEQRRRRVEGEAAARRAAGKEARHRRNSLILAAITLIAAIAMILVVYKTKPGTIGSLIALFAAPLLAGVAGAIIRAVLDDGSEWLKTALLGLGAGVIASLLFIASQLITSSTALQDKGVKTLVVLVTVVGFVAGITFDAVFKKLRQQDVVDTTPLGRS